MSTATYVPTFTKTITVGNIKGESFSTSIATEDLSIEDILSVKEGMRQMIEGEEVSQKEVLDFLNS